MKKETIKNKILLLLWVIWSILTIYLTILSFNEPTSYAIYKKNVPLSIIYTLLSIFLIVVEAQRRCEK